MSWEQRLRQQTRKQDRKASREHAMRVSGGSLKRIQLQLRDKQLRQQRNDA